ncbi:nucleotidyltransferase domain-containing protein [Candidatus Woesearchaeota archaeon]|nr:nucleotidyltransferase domain-containing protein [Candidatus Woesearchaeota archaeon]
MLKIIEELSPFFDDCYRRINVREYAKLMKMSPPTASKVLDSYYSESLLLKEKFRNYILFYANKDSGQFIVLSRLYWSINLKEMMDTMEKSLVAPTIVLFGSLSKAEAKADSDIDLAVFAHKKDFKTELFEKKLKRKIEIFWFASLKDIKNKELANNIINGYVLKGHLQL